MSDPIAVEEMSQEQYNEARVAGEVDETGHAVESDELNDEPDTYVKPAEGVKPEGEERPEAPPKRPWAKEEGDGTQGGIPNARWAANRIAIKTKDQELEEARAQIAALQAKAQPAEQEITDPDQLDRSKFVDGEGNFNGPAYLAAREAIVKKQAVAEIRAEIQAKEQERQVSELVGSYVSAVQEEAKTNPEIIDAVRHLDQFGPMMHPAVATLLMKLPPAVSFEVACNEEYIAQLVNGNPVESIALLGELKAMVKARGAQAAPAAQAQAAPQVAAFKPSGAAQPQAKHVPKVVGGGGTGRKDPEQETQDEYNRRRLREMRG